MKLFLSSLFLAVALSEASPAPFQNLGFDDVDTNGIIVYPGGTTGGLVADLLPGWSVTYSLGALTEIGYGPNSFPPGFGWAVVVAQDNAFDFPVWGSHGLALVPASSWWTTPPAPLSYVVSQVGAISADAQRIRFVNWGGPVELRVNGESVPITIDRQETWPTTLDPVRFVSADVSGFAGQTVELSFVATWANGAPPIRGLDNISFIVPEPSTWFLLSVGGLALIFLRRACAVR